MKVNKISIIVLSLFACFFAFGFDKGKIDIKVTIKDGALETVERSRPGQVFVYEIQPGDSGLWMERFTEILGVKGKIKETRDMLSVKDGSRYLEVRKVSNTVFYGDTARLWKEKPTPQKTRFNVPDDKKARELVLDQLGKLGFSSGDLKNAEISISDEKFEITLPQKEVEPISVVVGKNVAVRRRVGGLMVYGPGSKIKFYIGGNGEVDGIMALWRQVTPNSKVLGHKPMQSEPKGMRMKPISASEAFEILKKNPLDHLPLALVDRIDIDEVHFGYYSRSAVEHQKYLQPVYVFRGTAYANLPNGKRVGVPYEQYCVALERPVESIWPDTREYKSEPRIKGEIPKRGKDVDEKGG